MKYALAKIDKLINVTLHPSNLSAINLDEKEIQKLHSFAAAEYTLVCNQLKADFFSIPDEKQLELYVQRYQATVIYLADTLKEYISELINKELRQLYELILSKMEQLLFFIENYCSKYFNLDAKIPESYKLLSHQEFESNLDSFKKNARKLSLCNDFVQLIQDCFKHYANEHSNKAITFRQLIYHKKLLHEMMKIIADKSIRFRETEIINTMKYYNFNHARFFNFLTSRFKAELQELSTIEDKLTHLYFNLKSCNQFHTKPQFALYPYSANLKILCIGWLEEEIAFLEKESNPTPVILPALLVETSLVETTLTVPQLAFLIKLLVDKGVIKNQSYKHLTQVVAKYFRTSQTTHLSAESLRIKSHTPEHQTIQKVKDLLIDLHNYINNNFKLNVSMILLNHVFQAVSPVLQDGGY